MAGLIRSLKGILAGLARRIDRANANQQRWIMGLPVETADTPRRERS